ncbi:DUF636-domain-containing protein, partial [Cylindrobasidium torrendii FP15055 ss-10]
MTSAPKSLKPVEGGCLCGDIRYKLNFASTEECAKPYSAHLCHCSQCRKQSGALFLHFVVIYPPSTIEWLTPTKPTEYASSEKAVRGFCATCGSSLYWKSARYFEVVTGSIDAEYLQGEEWKVLSTAGHQAYYQSAIKGVTDDLFKYAVTSA